MAVKSLILLLLLWTTSLEAYPSGLGIDSSCSDLVPGHGLGGQTSPSPYKILFSPKSYLPGQRINVTVAGCGPMDSFKGFMIQARAADLNQGQSPLGNFTVGNNTQTACSGKALVHTNRNLKFNLTFNWTAPTDPVGPVVFRATFVKEYSVIWSDVVSEVLFNGSTNLLPNNVAKATTLNDSCTTAPVSCSMATEICANAYAKNVSLHPFNGSLICIDATNNLKCIFAACNYSPEMQAYLINSTQAALANVSSKCVINITVNPASGCQTATPICIQNHLRLLQNSYQATSGMYTYCPNVTDLYFCLSDGYCSLPEIILAIDSITSYDLSSRGIKCDVDFFMNGTMVTTTPAPVSCDLATSSCSAAYAKNVSLHPSNLDLICIDVNMKLRCIFKACNYSPEMEMYVINTTQRDIVSMIPNCKINVTASTVSACQRGTPACVSSYLTMLQNSQEATSGSVEYCPGVDSLYLCLSNLYCSMNEIQLAFDNITDYDLYLRGIKCDVDLFRNGTAPTSTPAPGDCSAATEICQKNFERNMSLHGWDNDLVCQDATRQLMCVIEACHYTREMQLMAKNYTIDSMWRSGYNCSINITISEVSACEREIPNCIENYLEKLNTSYEATSGTYKYCPYVDELYMCMSNYYCNYVEISNAIRNITFHELYSRGILCEIDLYRNETEPTPPMDCAAATNRCQEYFEGNLTVHYMNKSLVCQDATNQLLCVFAGCNYSPSMQQYSINITRQSMAASGYNCDINITVVSPCLRDAPQCIENHLSMLQNSTDATSGNMQYCPGVDKLYMCLSYLNCGYDEITNLINGISYYDLWTRGILCDVDLDQNGQLPSTTVAPDSCETGSRTCQANFQENMNAHYFRKDLVCEDATTFLMCLFSVCNYSPVMQEYTINATLRGLSDANYNCNLNLTLTSPCQLNKQTCIGNYLNRLNNSSEARSTFYQPCPMSDYLYMCLAQFNCDMDEITQAFDSITSYQLYNIGLYCYVSLNSSYMTTTETIGGGCEAVMESCQAEFTRNLDIHAGNRYLACQDATRNLECLFDGCRMSDSERTYAINAMTRGMAASGYICNIQIATECEKQSPFCIEEHLNKLQGMYQATSGLFEFCPLSDQLYSCFYNVSCNLNEINAAIDAVTSTELYSRGIVCKLDLYKGVNDGNGAPSLTAFTTAAIIPVLGLVYLLFI